jgi:colanic acid biosynthesis glycosyl transferase WcaI
MRILLINQFFWPDLAASSVLLTDFSRFLSESGHDVTVLCGNAPYAGPDCTKQPDVRIIRTPAVAFGRSIAARLTCYASFYTSAVWHAFTMPRPDLVVTMTTPPMISVIGALMRKFRRVRHYIWEMDMYPDVAVDLGLLSERSALTSALGAIADFGRRNSERVVALGECMKIRLLARGVPERKIVIAENWSDGNLFHPARREGKTGPVTVIYTGNLGLGHDVQTLSNAMFVLRNEPRLRFLFVGGGAQMRWLESFCAEKEIRSAVFFPYASRDRLDRIMDEADIGLVTQKPSCIGAIVPSKIYCLAASGLPILYVGGQESTPWLTIDRFGCGWTVRSGDTEGLQKLLRDLVANTDEIRSRGRAARDAFDENWNRPIAVRRLARALEIADQPVATRTSSAAAGHGD